MYYLVLNLVTVCAVSFLAGGFFWELAYCQKAPNRRSWFGFGTAIIGILFFLIANVLHVESMTGRPTDLKDGEVVEFITISPSIEDGDRWAVVRSIEDTWLFPQEYRVVSIPDLTEVIEGRKYLHHNGHFFEWR